MHELGLKVIGIDKWKFWNNLKKQLKKKKMLDLL